tara:strand:- start:188 stop:364 length:177 start_codon:yes stop_codon:yes gene_type:complete
MEEMILVLKKEESKLYKEYKNRLWKYGNKAYRTIVIRREWRVIAVTLRNLGISLKKSW